MPSAIAVLNRDGVIVLVNETWRRSALIHGAPAPNSGIGVNYLEICDAAIDALSAEARQARDGILAVLEGRAANFNLEYPCDSPTERRWFAMSVVPFQMDGPAALVIHTDITIRRQAEGKVSAAAQFLKNVFDNIPIPVFIKDQEGRYLACSRAFDQFFGFEPGSVVGKTSFDVFSPAMATMYAESDKKVLAEGQIQAVERMIAKGDGVTRDVITHLRRLALDDGAGTGLIGSLSDVTELKLSNEIISRQEKVIYRSPASIVCADLDGKITYWNQGAENLLGYRTDEVIGHDISILYFDEDREFLLSDVIGPLRIKGQHNIEVRARHQSGRPLFFLLSLWLTHDAHGEIDGMIGYGIDITEKKKFEQALRDSERKSEAERIDRLERQRDALVQEIHHRIKNHLQGVTGLLRTRIRRFPELSFAMEESIQQIHSIAEAYGLQSSRNDALVSLRSLLSAAVRRNAGKVPVRADLAPDRRDLLVPSEDVVPLALAINELLSNAMKHVAADRPEAFVDIGLSVDADTAVVTLGNGPALLPPGFDLDRAVGLGSGLNLLLTLLPSKRAKLSLRQDGPNVSAQLALSGLLPPGGEL